MDKKLRYLIIECFRLIQKEVSEKTIEAMVQFLKFAMIGITNTGISYGINIIVLMLMQPLEVPWDYIAGNIIGFILSVLWSFYWNNRLVFVEKEDEHRQFWKSLFKTYIAYGFTGIILNNILSWVWIHGFKISKYIAPLINLLISVPINFILNKVWAFKTEKTK